MIRHEPLPLWAGAICLLFVAVVVGWLILMVVKRAGPGERPADMTSTPLPVIVVTTEPTRPPAAPPLTIATPEPLLMTPVLRPVPTRTPTLTPPTSTATPEPTKKPISEQQQKG